MGTWALAPAAVALLAACAGPDPVIERLEVVARQRPGYVRVEVVVLNRSGGHGQVQLELRLQPTTTAGTITAEHPFEIDGHQRIELTVDIPAPDGSYTASASAHYPD